MTEKKYTWEEVQSYARERVAEETAQLQKEIADLKGKFTNICSYVNEMAYSKLKIEEHNADNTRSGRDEM